MIAEELRIGNYIKLIDDVSLLGKESGKVLIVNTTILQNLRGRSASDYEPILLTSEILGMAGFAKIGNKHDYRLWDVRIVLCALDVWRYDNGSVIIENMPEIKYIHQLQNLYFALTGEELKLTP